MRSRLWFARDDRRGLQAGPVRQRRPARRAHDGSQPQGRTVLGSEEPGARCEATGASVSGCASAATTIREGDVNRVPVVLWKWEPAPGVRRQYTAAHVNWAARRIKEN